MAAAVSLKPPKGQALRMARTKMEALQAKDGNSKGKKARDSKVLCQGTRREL